ncbi:MAG: PQQ-like domain [Ilumatobacteraceae bacterium]|nr:PQQ-like domain [Ilumatobacteraceae bacterium]
MPSASTCPSCGVVNRSDHRFCTACGAAIEAPVAAATAAGISLPPGIAAGPPVAPATFPAPAASIAPVTGTAHAPGHDGRSSRVRLIVGGVVGIAVIIGLALVVGGGGDSASNASAASLQRLPTEPKAKWTESFNGSGYAIGDDSTVFVSSYSSRDGVSVTALAATDGTKRWEQSFNADYGTLELIHDGGVVTRRINGSDATFSLLSADKGTPKWEIDDDDGSIVLIGGHAYLQSNDASPAQLRTIDLDTGKVGVRRKAEHGFSWVEGKVLALDDGSVQLYDESLETSGAPISVDNDTASATMLDGRIITADGKAVSSTDTKGKQLWRTSSPVGNAYFVRNVNGRLVVGGQDGTVVADVTGSGLQERWRTDDFFITETDTEQSLAVGNGDELRVLTMSDGTERARINGTTQSDSGPFQVVSNGVLVTTTRESSNSTKVDAYAFDGKPLWRLDGPLIVGDHWLATTESDGDGFSLTYYR